MHHMVGIISLYFNFIFGIEDSKRNISNKYGKSTKIFQFNQLRQHCNKKIKNKKQQLWLPEIYRKKYGSNILGFTDLP